ncbi:MAG: MG2 domain-containing protein [Defluviitaleaceae bacterium]|nr:MG2 domain-containing protein [Defluviitaleaceae bacterium]
MPKKANFAFYFLVAVIVLISVNFVQLQVREFIGARQERLASRRDMPGGALHRLHIVANNVYYLDGDFVAAVQLSDLSGQPVVGSLEASLLHNGYEASKAAAFETDASGRAVVRLPMDYIDGGMVALRLAVETDLGFEAFTQDFFMTQNRGQNFIIQFDKGLYNPGDEVLFRIMALANVTAQPVAGEMFTVSIFDGNDNRVFIEQVTASDFGIISGRFSLGDEVNSGMYRLAVEQNGIQQAEAMFEVSPFVLPRFEVTLATCQGEYNPGDTINLLGNAMYFFGEPVNQGFANIYVNNRFQAHVELGENGDFSFSYVAQNPGLFEFWVEVIDNSNNRIEAATAVRAAEGYFSIDLMPEFGYLIMGMQNRIYIFTYAADGAPVRAFLQVTGDGFSRQVATDHNGMGVLLLNDVRPQNNISVHAVDMYNNPAQATFSFRGLDRNLTISTNSPRYAMGEDIHIEINSRHSTGDFKLYIYRNSQLLQIIQTEQQQVSVNLGDVFGLIDIFAVWMGPGDNNHTNLPHAHRTVFVDPGRHMQLTMQSDRDEYKPGEFVSLNFGVTDDVGNPLEAALLVSIVDEAMLSLAANDLSIDNIRFALKDIYFAGNLDAATLYASLIAGASEQAITRLLLRQDGASPFVHTTWLVNRPWQRSSVFPAINVGILALKLYGLALATLVYFLMRRNKKEATKKNNERSIWVVLGALVLMIASLIFLASCAGRSADAFDGAPAPATAGEMFTEVAADSVMRFGAQDMAIMPSAPVPAEATNEAIAPAQDIMEIETQTARVRRLFLETMLFVPELIASNGQADLSFMLADNITTWNIQVVGNTRDGLLGHTQGSIRAFQPFFVDFELPRNSIRGDRVSIPVTVFNYTDYQQTVILTIAEMDWFSFQGEAVQTISIPSNRSQMVYVPILIEEFGDFVFRAYADAIGFADAAERPIRVNPEGFRVRRVVSSGSIEESIQQHLLFLDEAVADTRRATITFYPSIMAQVIEGMENIFRMPFGCFEQTSSILYPNILALRYMQQANIDNPALTEQALRYISSGYQRLLTFEVRGTNGGFSLFGHAPAETLLTAYGLMQLKDLTSVYSIDERVLDRMANFLFRHQNNDGSFQITGREGSRITASQRLAFNAYIIWALTEAFPEDNRLSISIEFLLANLAEVDDNYTLALIANALVNINHEKASETIDRLAGNVTFRGDAAYVTSTTRDYFGAFGRIQYLQATALTSIAFSNHDSHGHINELLVRYIISQRDSWGTWHSTQATILSLKALTTHAAQQQLESGQITVTVGGQQHIIDICGENSIDLYHLSFNNLERENTITIDFPEIGRMTYKIVQEFFAPYDSVQLDRGFEILSIMNTSLAVHELTTQHLRIINTSGDIVKNGLVSVSIPQGFRVERSSLTLLQHSGLIERYETRFENINLYLRDTEPGEIIDLAIQYRPAFPVQVTGGHVRVFDYYNPMVEGYLMPVEIIVE